ncbi:MAG: inositol monophosphatase family protein [Haloferacaceae archaeon]
MHGRRLATTEEVVAIAAPDSDEAIEQVESWATTHGIDLTLLDIGETVTDEHYDQARETLGITIGGDGAFLEGVRAFAPREIPFLGINTGTLSFLARVKPSDVTSALTEVLRGRATITGRGQYHVTGPDLDATGVNEITVGKVPPKVPYGAKVGRLHVFIDDEYVGEYFGTGVIVSTPTGSTGRALSNGGPIHYPSDNTTLQVVPFEAHNVAARPIVVSGSTTVRIVPETAFEVVVDGGREVVEIGADDVVAITGSDRVAHVVRTSRDDRFMPALTEKLGWGLRDVDDDGPVDRLRSAEGTEGDEDFLSKAGRVAREAALAVGEPLRELHGQVEQIEYKTTKSDLVTEADYQSQHIISTAIANEFPKHGFRSEEAETRHGRSDYFWLVDPVDGTGNFAHGNPNYAVSIALIDGDENPIVGVVYSPETDEMFHAIEGRGAYLNGSPIAPTDRDRLDESMFLSGYDPSGDFLQQFYHETRGVRRLGCAALHLAYVAAGSADAVWEYDTLPWDVAAGVLLIREAGGRITDADGETYTLLFDDAETRKPLVGSNGHIHDALLEHLVDE